jgi:hypothetical protein
MNRRVKDIGTTLLFVGGIATGIYLSTDGRNRLVQGIANSTLDLVHTSNASEQSIVQSVTTEYGPGFHWPMHHVPELSDIEDAAGYFLLLSSTFALYRKKR